VLDRRLRVDGREAHHGRFKPGVYRHELRITDHVTNQVVIRDERFAVGDQ
jgi:hypothetical protein